ncbi:MAG TPA: RNA polymerase sigma factor [Opitutaceae bacterium]|nr:RNA polymerase sigma factor [Opitutaceae bacterium]
MQGRVNLAEIYRSEYGRILASLIRVVRDFSLAEDSLQEAFAIAVAQWEEKGPPPNPAAWLMTTARNKAIDQIRRRTMAENKHNEMITLGTAEGSAPVSSDSLRLIFTCCHPAIAPESQIALTLRTVCGLQTEEIARAFLVPVPTIAQRIVRAKAKIKNAGIPYEVPEEDQLAERLESVLTVIYLVFNEGYSASFGANLLRAELCGEAIRLARQLVALLPSETEPRALLALMLLNDARRSARTDEKGELVLLEDQDRTRWDKAKIEEGRALVDAVVREGPPTSYAVQAAILAVHTAAATSEETDWKQISALYGVLAQINPSPVIELNRAIAVGMADGFEHALTLIDKIELPDYYLLPASRADLLRRLGRNEEAAKAYRSALKLVSNEAERRYLERRLQEVISG